MGKGRRRTFPTWWTQGNVLPHSALGYISNHFNAEIHSTSAAEPGPPSLMGVRVQRVDLCKAREALFLRECQKLEIS